MHFVFSEWRLRITLAILFTLSFYTCLIAQQNKIVNTPTDNLIPPSPEASALAKYAQIPVGLYTGTPQISIPVWTLQEGDINLNISLSYHASGIKVEEVASRVGAGWTLNAGGMVTRTAVGECDEYSDTLTGPGYGIVGFFWGFGRNYTPESMFVGNNAQLMERFQGINDCLDAEPDQFSFNFGGYTLQFAFNWGNSINPSDRIVVTCSRKLRIEVIGMPQPGDRGFIQGFNITTEDGTLYEFSARETTDIPNRYNPVRRCDYINPGGELIAPVNSWYLTRITSPKGNTVNFEYTPYNLQYKARLSESVNHKYYYDTNVATSVLIQPMTIEGVYLTRIVTGSGNMLIDFIRSAQRRQDLLPRADGSPNLLYSLNDIVVRNRWQTVKTMKLNYDYSIGRLTLKSIQELPVYGSSVISKPPYLFTYNTAITLPSQGATVLRVSEQDHFGYYNSNPEITIIPEYRAISEITGLEYVWPGGNRSPDANRMQAGILTGITYPAGGTTTFEYEPHDYRFVGATTATTNAIAGGLRVKKITDYDGINTANNMVRTFEYKMEGTESDKSSGVIAVLPRYEYKTLVYTYDAPSEQNALLPCLSRVSGSVITLGTTQGSYVGYRRVAVYQGEYGEGGKSVSYYTSFYDQNDDYTNSFKQPFPQATAYDFRRGLLTRQIDLKYQGNSTPYVPVRETTYEYDSVATAIFGLKVGEVCSGCRSNPNFSYGNWQANVAYPYGKHWLVLGLTQPKKITETLFENGASHTASQSFAYDANLHFIQSDTATTSEGKKRITLYAYPFNYTSPATYDMTMMKHRHMLSPVIEKIVKERSANGSERIIDASYTQYRLDANNRILPLQSLQMASVVPALSMAYSVDHGGWWDLNLYTGMALFDRYNAKGNVEQITTPGNVISSYIWGGYDSSQLLAKVNNAPFERCASTSFENGANEGNWNFSESALIYRGGKTGKCSFSGTVTSKSNLTAGRYIVSLWAKTAGSGNITVNGITKQTDATWKRYEWLFTNPGTININANSNYIDELRLHPEEATMQTFVQEQGIGLTAVTDENHSTTSYEYDGFGRLKNVKDRDGNIRKNYSYHYKN